jgi:general secretion pathway protein H
MEFWENGYAFYELNDMQQWLPLEEDKLFRVRELPEGMRMQLTLEGIDIVMSVVNQDKPQVFILSSGETSPFILQMTLDGEYAMQINVDALGKIENNQGDEDDDRDERRTR